MAETALEHRRLRPSGTGAHRPPEAAVGALRTAGQPRHCRHHRTIFISDTHLGTRGCKAEALADFLAHNDCATLFLVGDIVDGWQLKRRWYWTEAQSRVRGARSCARWMTARA